MNWNLHFIFEGKSCCAARDEHRKEKIEKTELSIKRKDRSSGGTNPTLLLIQVMSPSNANLFKTDREIFSRADFEILLTNKKLKLSKV